MRPLHWHTYADIYAELEKYDDLPNDPGVPDNYDPEADPDEMDRAEAEEELFFDSIRNRIRSGETAEDVVESLDGWYRADVKRIAAEVEWELVRARVR